ncbi:MAG TPA: hypothetical protein PLP21_05685 [Pyrinomonadaceae bacterium]|nr:hypothetical protein [Acidobacteriota bacterium]HQZ95788.1 hypothetical protein [Pyrinomonadaceae bacterium]
MPKQTPYAYNYQMVIVRSGIFAIAVVVASMFSACGGNSGNGNTNAQKTATRPAENPNTVRTNVEELGVLVKVPYETEDIVWKEITAKKKIIAIMRFSAADANKIVAEAGGTPENTGIAVESWFPEELIAQTEMSGDNALKGVSYPATAFYQDPYTSGKITRVEGSDYFILEIQSK